MNTTIQLNNGSVVSVIVSCRTKFPRTVYSISKYEIVNGKVKCVKSGTKHRLYLTYAQACRIADFPSINIMRRFVADVFRK